MMQHVATVLSDIAAFATGTGSNSTDYSDANEQFSKVMQQQSQASSASREPRVSVPNRPQNKEAHSSDNTAKPNPANKHNDKQPVIKQGEAVTQKEQQPPNSEVAKAVEKNTASVDKNQQQQVKDSVAEKPHKDKLTSEKQATEDNADNNTDEQQLAAEFDQLKSSEWFDVVEKLHKFQTNIRPETSTPSEPAKIDLLSALTQQESAGTEPEVGTEQPNNDGQKLAADATDVIDNPVLSGAGDKLKAKLNQDQALQQGVKKFLSQLGTNGTEQLSHQQAVEQLLKDPESLQALMQELAVSNDTSSLNGKLVSGAQAPKNQDTQSVELDITASENAALLKVLLQDSATTDLQSDSKAQILAKPSVQPNLSDVALAELESSQRLNSSNTPEVSKHTANNANSLNFIASLSDNKINKVLEHIAAQVLQDKQAIQTVKPEELAQQVNFSPALETQIKDFVSVLKSGVEEFKQQLAQGREPGLDLKTLVSEALVKATDVSSNSANLKIEQLSQNLGQLFDFSQGLNRAVEQHQEQSYQARLRDVTQVQAEQSKQLQLNQLESKFEKAINISKPEGHQQLAEKVRWMVNTRNLVADIRLDPAELGSVQVKVAMSGETATVNFVVQSQQARDAVDTATPRLKEMLAEKGIELGQSSVQQEDNGQNSHENGELANGNAANQGLTDEAELTEQVVAQQSVVNGALGGIDYFV